MAKKRTGRERQGVIPGTRPDMLEDIEEAAKAYADAKDERVNASNEETRTRKALTAALKKHRLTRYRCVSLPGQEAAIPKRTPEEPKAVLRKVNDPKAKKKKKAAKKASQ